MHALASVRAFEVTPSMALNAQYIRFEWVDVTQDSEAESEQSCVDSKNTQFELAGGLIPKGNLSRCPIIARRTRRGAGLSPKTAPTSCSPLHP